MTKETVRDLIALLTRHADLRSKIKQALFPDIDLQRALQELALAQKRTEGSIQQLSSGVEQLSSR